MVLFSPSVLTADFMHLGDAVAALDAAHTDMLHLDVMDGVFVPNISFGFPVLKAAAGISTKPLDIHLMIVEPEKFIPQMRELGEDVLMNVHYEACPHLHRVIQEIKNTGMKAGVTLNPATPVAMVTDIVEDVDMVLLMSVNPGFGGQKFIPHTIRKIAELRELIERKGAHTLIEVDGGVNLQTAPLLAEAGADILVAGSAVFNSPDVIETIRQLKSLKTL